MKKKDKNINFVLNIDGGYVNQSVVTMTSILLNLNKECKATFYIYFMGYKSKPKIYNKLEKHFGCIINCIPTKKYDKIFKNLVLSSFQKYWSSIAPFYRLLMFKFLPDDVDFAYYIDADIVVDGDLSKLYLDFKSKNKFFGSVADVWFLRKWLSNKRYYRKFEEFDKLILNRLKYPYFCDGFYLANIKMCKQVKAYEHMLDFLKKHPDVKQADQDVMNAVFSQKFSGLMTYFPLAYDILCGGPSEKYYKEKKFYYSKQEIIDSFEHPIVIHYAGPAKPWKSNLCINYDKWWYYYNKSILKKEK